MIERYQSAAVAAIWSDEATFARWTRVEIAACEAWHARGEIAPADMEQIRTKAHHQSALRMRAIEAETQHDVVAFVRAVQESVGAPADRHVHRGLTSSDVVDTALALAIGESLGLIIERCGALRVVMAAKATRYKHTPCAGRTHGMHAEPTTFGLRLAGFAAELDRNLARLRDAQEQVRFGKLSGAVGTFSQTDPAFEAFALEQLRLKPEPVATQVVPRDRHAVVLNALALLGAALERFATEVRSLQRTDVREAEEPFKAGQTGSSAMPHKRNPILSERLCGMARMLRGYALMGFENIALWHDRDISHSSVERVVFPDAFHLAHTMLELARRVFQDLRVSPERMIANIERAGGLLCSQSVLAELLATGLDRTTAYRLVQRNAMNVWEGKEPHLRTALERDHEASLHLDAACLDRAFDLKRYSQHVDALFARAGIEEL